MNGVILVAVPTPVNDRADFRNERDRDFVQRLTCFRSFRKSFSRKHIGRMQRVTRAVRERGAKKREGDIHAMGKGSPPLLRPYLLSNSAPASCRSGVSKPSVNQP